MKQTINFYQFRDAFRSADRMNNFSSNGLNLLFAYLEDYEDSTGEEIELDVIAVCCDYAEATIDELVDAYSIDVDGLDDNEKRDAVMDFVNEHSLVVGECADGTIIYAQF
jgi:hypothetical protein